MKKTAVILATLLLAPVMALAEMRIAVIDPIRAISETSEVKERTSALELDMKKKEAEMIKLRDEIMALEERLKRDGMTMSSEQQKSMSDQRDAKMLDFRSRQQLAQKRMEQDRDEMLSVMEPRLKQAIDKIAAEGKYDLIITRQAVLYAAEQTDVTRQVTQIMNQMK
ncbi:MAG: OmpH family outer membrane protein [Alcanivoracaceae bacterium]|nr:OmpH family outer membrane protein [Alcanivoracaceae bacterium]